MFHHRKVMADEKVCQLQLLLQIPQQADKKKMKEIRKEIQMIFQDPYSSLDPRMTVLDIIKEPLRANYPNMSKDEMDQKAKAMASR